MTQNGDAAVHDLSTSECWQLLRSATVGRLAVSHAGRPDIFPINYVVDHGTIVFRTAEGRKLSTVARNPVVALEADGWAPDQHVAWSVVVIGRGERVRGTQDLLDSMRLPLYPWHAGRKEVVVRIVVERITGRRFDKADPAIWRTAIADAPRAAPE